jgi:hypothetical protein
LQNSQLTSLAASECRFDKQGAARFARGLPTGLRYFRADGSNFGDAGARNLFAAKQAELRAVNLRRSGATGATLSALCAAQLVDLRDNNIDGLARSELRKARRAGRIKAKILLDPVPRQRALQGDAAGALPAGGGMVN